MFSKEYNCKCRIRKIAIQLTMRRVALTMRKVAQVRRLPELRERPHSSLKPNPPQYTAAPLHIWTLLLAEVSSLKVSF